jgi:hypothetical protein
MLELPETDGVTSLPLSRWQLLWRREAYKILTQLKALCDAFNHKM